MEANFIHDDRNSGSAYEHGSYTEALGKLEREALVARDSPRTGFTSRDGAGLLEAWIRSGERTAARATAYFAPNTRPERLAEAAAASRASGVESAFTPTSGLLPGEVFVSGLPHGAYASGDVSAFEEKLELQQSTPHD
jgi:hypothetical protein